MDYEQDAKSNGSKNHTRHFFNALLDPIFDYYLDKLKVLQEKSVRLKTLENGGKMLEIQSEIIAMIVKSQVENKQCVTHLKTETDPVSIERLGRLIFIWKSVNRISRTIADGIAWRMLGHDRAILRILSEAATTGNIEHTDKGFRREASVLDELAGASLVNDCTRCLRTGDITQIYIDSSGNRQILLHEIKVGRPIFNKVTLKNLKPGAISFQNKRLLRAQAAIDTRVLSLDDKQVFLDWLDFPMPHFFTRLKKIIKEARNNGHCSYKIDDCITVRCFSFRDVDKVNSDNIKKITNSIDRFLPYASTDFLMESGGEFIRNGTPVSALPLDIQDQMDMMSGHVEVSIAFNLTKLQELLLKNGWEVMLRDIGSQNIRNQAILQERLVSKDRFSSPEFEESLLSVRKDGFVTGLDFNHIGLCGFGYYKTQTLLNLLNAAYENGKKYKSVRHVSYSYVQERNILV